MKESAILINVGRGPIVVEEDLCEALEHGEIAAAGLDVLTEEPMNPENPLLKIQDSTKLLITPHIGWASKEARVRLMDIVAEQVREFVEAL
jgi:glycerate dehydrogenase